MKLEKNKHNHKLTDLLKIGIFALLMIAPLLASVSQMLYATCNKNAKDSWSGTTWTQLQPIYYESNEVNSINDILLDNIYYYEDNVTSLTYINYTQVRINKDLYLKQYPVTEFEVDRVLIYFSQDYVSVVIADSGNERLYRNINSQPMYLIIEDFGVKEFYPTEFVSKIKYTDFKYIKDYEEVTQQETLDNAFYYGVDRMTKEELFNWTQNTLLYSGIKGMTDNLGVQTNAIAILITYWTILTIIYVILDIVIKGFTFITHLIVRSE